MTVAIEVHRAPVPVDLRTSVAAVLADAFAEDDWGGHRDGPRRPGGVPLLMQVAADVGARRGGLVVAHQVAGRRGPHTPRGGRDRALPPLVHGAAVWVPADRRGGGPVDAVRARAVGLPLVLGPRGLGRVLRDEADTDRAVDPHVGPGDAYLWVLGVRRDRHGHGLGRALVEATATDATERGHGRLVLVTHDPRNVAVYRALGFILLQSSRRASGITLHVLARELRTDGRPGPETG
ncbi:GNAT family N-acetyltransferase [Aquipuribacter sp. MA13-6]|uniref:GNAT family N-acetyltransferase n=1 Tax=unclassified Aquipuribacter TaxID=2635084 RepID=UPI003EEC7C44